MRKCQAEEQRRQRWNVVTTARRVWFSFNVIENHIKVGGGGIYEDSNRRRRPTYPPRFK